MTSSLKLYQHIEITLRSRITQGHYRSGENLPAESALCEEFKVSRITIRRALDELAASGLISRQQGRGTVVVDPVQLGSTLKLRGYIEDAIPWNRYTVLSDEPIKPPDPIAVLFALAKGSGRPVRRVLAVNQPGGQALGVSEFYFPDRYAPLVEQRDFAGNIPVIRLIEQRSGLPLAYAEQLVEAIAAPAHVARYLEIRAALPILRTTRFFFAEGGEVLQAVQNFHHPERYRFVATLLPRGVVQATRPITQKNN